MKNIDKIILSTLYYMVNLTNSKDILANSISVIDKDKVIDLQAFFYQNFTR